MAGHVVTLEARHEIAAGTLELRFSRPPGFAFRAGQAVDLTLLDRRALDAAGPRRAFSLVGAPAEPGLTVATRLRDSAFKRVLAELPLGASVDLMGPFGAFALHADRRRPAVFIAGGIGITPIISLLRQAEADGLPRELLLIYANRRPSAAAYLDELVARAARDPRFRLVATMTEAGEGTGWPVAKLDERLIGAAATGLVAPVYYAVGPPAMVGAVRGALDRLGVSPDDLRSEEFAGY